MGDILLKRNNDLAVTSVPNSFIDDYMVHANGEFVKIYLYLLRCMSYPDTPFSISATADKFEQPESDIKRALKYWEKMHLLHLEFNAQDEVTEICLLDSTADPAPAQPAQKSLEPASFISMPKVPEQASSISVPKVQEQASSVSIPKVPEQVSLKRSLPKRTPYSREQMEAFSTKEDIQEIFFLAEKYVGHPLSSTEIQTMFYWIEELKLTQELIEYLLESCIEKGHKSFHYMDKVALAWAEEGIQSLSEAKQTRDAYSTLARKVQKAFGITGRSLAQPEIEAIQSWSADYGFDDDIIVCACERTIRQTHNINFEYTKSILSNWKKQNVRSLKDIELLDAQYQEAMSNRNGYYKKTASARTASGTTVNRFTNIPQRSYDYDALERELLIHS